MGTSWAVASAAILALSLAHALLDLEEGRPEGMLGLGVVALGIVMYGTWAYGIAMAAHGDKGALAGLLAYALLWGFGRSGATIDLAAGPLSIGIHALNLLAGALGAWGISREMRARRGATRWGSFAFLVLPLLALLALLFAL